MKMVYVINHMYTTFAYPTVLLLTVSVHYLHWSCFMLPFLPPATMKLGKFHHSFLELFTPVVVQYVEGLEADLRDDLIKSFMTESWMPVR